MTSPAEKLAICNFSRHFSAKFCAEVAKIHYICIVEPINDSMNGDSLKRISQEGQRQNEAEGGILESASAFAQRVLEEIEALAGTTACKPVQLVSLKQWAQEQGC